MPKSLADISYAPETGLFYYAGRVHGTVNAGGYIVFRADSKVFYAHRVAWFKVHGVWPDTIDHINGNRTDNRLCNLRSGTQSDNARNMKLKATPLYKALPGAHYHKPSGGWKSSIRYRERSVHLGYFESAEDANEMYLLAKEMLHPTFRGYHAKVVSS